MAVFPTTFIFLFLVIGLVTFIAPWGQFPLNDDWVYAKNVVDSLARGKFTVSSGQYAYAIPQVLIGLLLVEPGEPPFLALRWIGIFSGVLGTVLTTRFCLNALNNRSSLLFFLGCISLFFFLPFLQTTVSFMTDIPAFLLWVVSLWSLAWFLKKKTTGSWFVAFIANALAVSERQLAIFIPLSVVLFQNSDWRSWFQLRGIQALFRKSWSLILFCVPLILIHFWWSSISPVSSAPHAISPNPGIFSRLFYHLIHLGWMALPFLCLPLISTKALERDQKKKFRNCLIAMALGVLFMVAQYLIDSRTQSYRYPLLPPFFGNVLSNVGILPITLDGFSEIIFPLSFRLLLLGVGLAGAFQILKGFSLIWSDFKSSDAELVILSSSLFYLCFIFVRATHFDRYIIPAIPLCLLCLLRVCKTENKISFWRKIATAVAIFIYVAFSTTLVSDYFRWNEARWKAIDFAFSRGIQKHNLLGGHEYGGWYDTMGQWETRESVDFVVSPTHDSKRFEVVATFPHPAYWYKSQKQMYLLKRKRELDGK